MKIQGTTGSGRLVSNDGEPGPIILDRTGGWLVAQGHAPFKTGTIRGQTFHAATAVAGVAPGTTLSTTAAFWVHNPLGSGVVLSLLQASVGYVSGTLGAGTVFLTSHAGVPIAIPAGTAIVSRCGIVGGNATPSAVATTTTTTPTQIALKPLFRMGPALATTAMLPARCTVRLGGIVLVPPGYGVGLSAVAGAGTTPKVIFGMSWEEIPLTLPTTL